MGCSTMQGIVKSVSKAIWTLYPIYMPVYTEQDWLHSAKLFWQCWNFPYCCGAVDGKHIVIQKPPKSRSYFFNYKHTFSINLMAIVDAAYKFISIEVGSVGCNNDSTVFTKSGFGKQFLSDNVSFPSYCALPGTADLKAPHVIVGDEAFPCTENIMRPYSRSKGYCGK